MEIFYFIAGIALGAAVALLIAKFKYESKKARLEAEHSLLLERVESQKSESEEMRKQLILEFENLANKIFDEKNVQNKSNLTELLQPLGERIRDFEKKVGEIYLSESNERASLKEQLKHLHDLNQQMSREANNLTKALKGDPKTRGAWGELVLETILEKSGLEKGREFFVQETVKDDDGSRKRLDVVIKFPENKNVVIDSKVSLIAYEGFCSAEDEPAPGRQKFLADHILSVRNHLKNLSRKNYNELYGINSLDFVLMFVPVEPAFALAVQHEPELFYEAFEKNIVIVCPSTLIATLRTISIFWRQEKQNRNALEIAKQSGDLYEKFVAFVEDLYEVGKRLGQTQSSYENAMSKLRTGKGNIVIQIEKIKKLGADTNKTLPQDLLDYAQDSNPPAEQLHLINPSSLNSPV